ncbi:outer membrane protein [Flexibacterium corallicola]|uniref:outer membrane protein n=1 Tax=Flexibacterium corallicola TaxID=3037259 RepID=UPI00286F98F0|nr:porin family protein [Pseudovibrio sp. M1P-2-3]
MLRIASGSALLAVLATSAFAADLPQETPVAYEEPVTVQGYDWNGAYAGASAGWGFLGADGKSGASGALDTDTDGVNLGVFGGYNFMASPNILLGTEADISFNDYDKSVSGTELKSDWNGSLRGRAGYVMDRTLVYGTGGLALADFEAKSSSDKDDTIAVGYVVGAGVEQALTDRVNARIEYNYQDFGTEKFDLDGETQKVSLDDHLVRAGVSVNF